MPRGFSDLDLYGVDAVTIPAGLEEQIGKAKCQQIPDGFLAQVVINAVYLLFFEVTVNQVIQASRGLEVTTERLLDYQASPTRASVESGFAERRDYVRERYWRKGEVEHPIARKSVFDLNSGDLVCERAEVGSVAWDLLVIDPVGAPGTCVFEPS